MKKGKTSDSIDFLLASVCHLHFARVQQLLEALGLYRGQPGVLRELWEQEGLTQRDLAERLQISPVTVTKMLQRMEKTGFVTRKADLDDQRISRVYLTDAGRSVQSQVEGVFQTMEAETFANLTPEEMALLRRLLMQLRQNLMEVTGEVV